MTSSDRCGEYRILVADDDPEMRRLVVDALRADGYDVREASSGAGLLDQMSSYFLDGTNLPIDLVISDIRMPLITGLEMLAGLRAVDCPMDFILMTAFGDEKTQREAERLGALALFDKPFELSALRALVRDRFAEASAYPNSGRSPT